MWEHDMAKCVGYDVAKHVVKRCSKVCLEIMWQNMSAYDVAKHTHPAGWPYMETLRPEAPESAVRAPVEELACASSSAEVWALSWYASLHVTRAHMEEGAESGLWRVGASCGLLLLEKDSHPSSSSLQQQPVQDFRYAGSTM